MEEIFEQYRKVVEGIENHKPFVLKSLLDKGVDEEYALKVVERSARETISEAKIYFFDQLSLLRQKLNKL